LKKQNKAHYFSNEHKSSKLNIKRNAEGEHSESPNPKKARIEQVRPQSVGNEKPEARNSTKSSKSVKSPEDEPFVSSPNKTLPKATSKLEEEDEAYIAYLESKLGMGKTGKKKSSKEDGLDGIRFSIMT
jgi:nucleolar MIF4G domain-containing protein 1